MWSHIVQCPSGQVYWDHSCCLGPLMCTRSVVVQTPPCCFEEKPSALSCQAKQETAYITLVHSTLEYAASIWDMHLAKDCDLLEKLQRRSARFVKGDYRTTSSVSQMLLDLGWHDLKDHQCDLRLALLYKIVTGHVAINPGHIGLLAVDNRTRANHRYKFRAIGASSTGCATHLLSEQSVIGTSSLLLMLSRRLQLPSNLCSPDQRLSPVTCHNPLPPPLV